MINQQYDAVIFDLDGTLIDSMWVWEKIDECFLKEYHIEVPTDMDRELEGKSFTETAEYFKRRFKLEISVEGIKDRWNQLAREFYKTEVPLKEGAKEFLEKLKARDIKIGIATSNSVELVQAVLEALDIERYFSEIKTSCEVGKGKPFPDIYLKVAEGLKVEPSRCLIFEDIPNGIRAGKNAGMTAWLIKDRQSDEILNEAKAIADDYVINYYEAIQKLLTT